MRPQNILAGHAPLNGTDFK